MLPKFTGGIWNGSPMNNTLKLNSSEYSSKYPNNTSSTIEDSSTISNPISSKRSSARVAFLSGTNLIISPSRCSLSPNAEWRVAAKK